MQLNFKYIENNIYTKTHQIILLNFASLKIQIVGKQLIFYVFTDINQKNFWKYISIKKRKLLEKISLITFQKKFKW